ncbi:MAG: sulfate ABC transporter substrate-binding protein [Actinomycetota bacterium]|nr:sulfate ABC transporter substrate-binding protein [Actinomycetota bacterium]
MKKNRLAVIAAIGTVSALSLTACGTSSASTGGANVKLALVAYSTPQAAYAKIIPAFQKTAAGKGVTFSQSYGASGDQSRAVEAGQNADVVAFSLEPDVTRLVKANLVAKDWNADTHKGMITDSVVVVVTRKGNPKNIKDWSDLARPGVQVITPNPFTSGGARWNVMAAYGANSQTGKDQAAGLSYLNSLFHNVPVQDDSARKSLQTFVGGKGDALLAYENEAIFAQQKKQPIDYVVPSSTILIENPAAVTAKSKHPKEAKAFLDFLHSKKAQQIFADNGYRPVVEGAVSKPTFPAPADLFTIADFGGWSVVSKKFFDPTTGLMADVERKLGVSVVKK